jgi:hypothetical protein
MTKTVKALMMYRLTCLRCGGSWISKTPKVERCGRQFCRTPYWNIPRNTLKRGRPRLHRRKAK